jgi:hypothetical protein
MIDVILATPRLTVNKLDDIIKRLRAGRAGLKARWDAAQERAGERAATLRSKKKNRRTAEDFEAERYTKEQGQ